MISVFIYMWIFFIVYEIFFIIAFEGNVERLQKMIKFNTSVIKDYDNLENDMKYMLLTAAIITIPFMIMLLIGLTTIYWQIFTIWIGMLIFVNVATKIFGVNKITVGLNTFVNLGFSLFIVMNHSHFGIVNLF